MEYNNNKKQSDRHREPAVTSGEREGGKGNIREGVRGTDYYE